jgi:hypothetical protein
MVEILYTHVWKWKIETSGNYFRMGVGQLKEYDGGYEFNYDIL